MVKNFTDDIGHTPTIKISMRLRLRSSTTVGRVMQSIQWLELFMMQFIRNEDWNTSTAAHWLVNNPNPMFYRTRLSPDGMVQIECNAKLVNTKLQIGGMPTPVPLAKA